MKSDSERQNKRRQQLKQQGRERLELWPKLEHKPILKDVARELENERSGFVGKIQKLLESVRSTD